MLSQGVAIVYREAYGRLTCRRCMTSTAAGISGTGLGLDLARKFIDLHGGKIAVQSKLRQGSTFTFTLPLNIPATADNQEMGVPA